MGIILTILKRRAPTHARACVYAYARGRFQGWWPGLRRAL